MVNTTNFSCSNENYLKYLWNWPLGVILLTVYIFVLIVLFHYRKTDFTNSFYRFVNLIGLCDLYNVSYMAFYFTTAQVVCGFPLGKVVDNLLAHVAIVTITFSVNLQLMVGINRLVAIVWYSKYQLFEHKWTNKLIAISFSIACIIAGSTLGQMQFDIEKGVAQPAHESKVVNLVAIILAVINGVSTAVALITLYSISFAFLKQRRGECVSSQDKKRFKLETKLLFQGFMIAVPLILQFLTGVFLGYRELQKIILYITFGGNPFIYLAVNRDLRKRCHETLPVWLVCKSQNAVGNISQNPAAAAGPGRSKEARQAKVGKVSNKPTLLPLGDQPTFNKFSTFPPSQVGTSSTKF